MSTSAAVYVSLFDTTVRVNGDGYPENTKVALERIVAAELLSELCRHSEYSVLAATAEEYESFAASYAGNPRYVLVDRVGLAFPEDDACVLETQVTESGYIFENSENYNYVVKDNGEVVVYKN